MYRVYRPLSGPLIVTVPPAPWPGRRPWLPLAEYQRYCDLGWAKFSQWKLLKDCGVPRPVDIGNGSWSASRTYQNDLPQAIADRIGSCELVREFDSKQKCDKRCRDARGSECVCSCLGKYHGYGGTGFDSGPGMEIGEDTLIAVNGDVRVTRTLVVGKD